MVKCNTSMSVLMPGEAQGAESEPVAARGMDGCDWVGASGFDVK